MSYLRGLVIPSRGRREVIFFLALVAHACAISAHRREGRFMGAGATWAIVFVFQIAPRAQGLSAAQWLNSAWHCGRQTGAAV